VESAGSDVSRSCQRKGLTNTHVVSHLPIREHQNFQDITCFAGMNHNTWRPLHVSGSSDEGSDLTGQFVQRPSSSELNGHRPAPLGLEHPFGKICCPGRLLIPRPLSSVLETTRASDGSASINK